MIDLIHLATGELARFLEEALPKLSPEWWQKHVFERLTFQQQRLLERSKMTGLHHLDFATLLRVMDQNWFDLSTKVDLPREARTWVKELQTVRNKWAHSPAEGMPVSELYRDADTLGRLLGALGAQPGTMEAVEFTMGRALAALADSRKPGRTPAAGPQEATRSEPEPQPSPSSLFQLGQVVGLRSDPSQLMPIIEVIPGGAEYRYRVFQNNTRAVFYESQLLAPAEAKDEHRIISVSELRALLTSRQILSPSVHNLFSLREGRVQFVPYQYRPVMKLIRSDRPRLLIADEVGVGKTIEAGLIIKELQARMEVRSVLIICPKALVAERKWEAELKRFDETFVELDGAKLRHCLKATHLDGEWPDLYAKAIVPFSLFDWDLLQGRVKRGKVEQGLLHLDPPPRFDLVIVDEAHHIRNSETFLHQGVRYFCEHAQAVVLMTATPVQLGSQDLFTLLNVLRPDVVIDLPSFQQMAEPNRAINAAVRACREGKDGWQRDARVHLSEVAATEWGRMFLREAPEFQAAYDQLSGEGLNDTHRVNLVRAIEELYTFSPYINRTRRRDIGEFTTRKPETLPIGFTEPQQQLHDDLLALVAKILAFNHGNQNVKFMMTTLRRQAASCLYGLVPLLEDMLLGKVDNLEAMEASDNDADVDLEFVCRVRGDLQAVLDQARQLDPKDPKVDAFVKVLQDKAQLENNKALVFSTFRHTIRYLATYVEAAGLRCGLIDGRVPDEERSALRERFKLPREDAQALDVLLSTEVGCEGLDFQFCDLLINYDLPWNPMKIEQRIGRIDRYGQKSEAIVILNFVTPGTVDAEIYDRCLSRIGVFHHAVGGSEEILGEIKEQLHDIASNFQLTGEERAQRLQQMSDNRIHRMQEEQELESQQSELFGLNIPNQTWQQEIEEAESYWLAPEALKHVVATYLASRLGRDTEFLLGERQVKTLRLGQEARAKLLEDYHCLQAPNESVGREWEKWLKGSQPTLAVTFDQQTAADNSRITRLSVLHPLVRQAARHLTLGEAAHVFLRAKAPKLPPGCHPFVLYSWRRSGVRLDETLVPVAGDPAVEAALMALLPSVEGTGETAIIDTSTWETLDHRHHSKWAEARANHIAEHRQLAEHQGQSLKVSHQARCRSLEDQVKRATNDKIRIMKEAELARANLDFDRHSKQVQEAGHHADLNAMPVVYGTLVVEGGL